MCIINELRLLPQYFKKCSLYIPRHKCEPFLYSPVIPLNPNNQNGLTVCVVAL